MPDTVDAADPPLEVASKGEDRLFDREERQKVERRVVDDGLEGEGVGVAAGLGEAAEDEASVAAVVVVVVVVFVFILAVFVFASIALGARPPPPPRRDDGGGGLGLKPPEAQGLGGASEGAQEAERGVDERAAEGFSCKKRRKRERSREREGGG